MSNLSNMGRALAISALFVAASGCMTAYKKSVGANTQQSFARIYATDFNTAWQSVLDALKSIRLDVTNREAGFLQSRWMDNTVEKNFTDGDGTTPLYMKAQYRFKVTVAPGIYHGKNAVKVSVQREQFAQRDALDDVRPLESDSIEENTLLYRIGRIVSVKTRLARFEEYQTQREIRKATEYFAPPASSSAEENLDVPLEAPADGEFLPDAPTEEL